MMSFLKELARTWHRVLQTTNVFGGAEMMTSSMINPGISQECLDEVERRSEGVRRDVHRAL